MRMNNIYINIDDDSLTKEKRDIIDKLNKSITKICNLFDTISSIEEFFIERFKESFTEIINLRARKSEFNNNKEYLKYFVILIKDKNKEIDSIKKEYNESHDDKISDINLQFDKIRNIYKKIVKILEEENFDSIKTVKEALQLFAKFDIFKAINDDNIINRFNNLLKSRDLFYLDNIDEKLDEDISIDDL